MSAIGGILNLPAEDETIARMLKTMKRRGPDGESCCRKDNMCLMQTTLRLSDCDSPELAEAGIPEEEYALVMDGEFYNRSELRDSLERLGYPVKNQPDGILALYAYRKWGEKCLERFNGIYALAVLEKNRGRVFLARDRMGAKPLFYMEHGGGLLFASEMKTIFCYPGVKAELDAEGAAQLIMLGPGRIPGSGIFRGIRELEPGCCGYYKNHRLSVKRYWSLTDREHRENFEETAEHVRHLLTDAILRQSAGDEPIGTFLSGGLDSSLITAVCAEKHKAAGQKLPTFSVDYVNNDRYFVPNHFQPNSDSYYIKIMEQAFETDHHWCILSAEDLYENLKAAMEARDLPGMADVDASLLAFCRKIRQEVPVALSGECADEIFGGYPWYRDPEVRHVNGFPWAQNTDQRMALLLPNLKKQINGADFVKEQYEKTCRESDILPGTDPEERRIRQMVNLNLRWFMQTLSDRNDRMSMYSGLQVRTPFSDYRIAEYLYSVPWEYKNYQGREKGLLRYAMADLLPDEVLWRKKSPYPKTFDPAYENMVRAEMKNLLAHKNAPLFGLVSHSRVEEILTEETPLPWYGQLMRRPQIIAYLLQINMWMEKYSVDLVY